VGCAVANVEFLVFYFFFSFFFPFCPFPFLPTPSFYFIVSQVEIYELSFDNDELIGEHKNTRLLVFR